MRRLCLILGDQLDRDPAIFKDFDREQDMLWMAEVPAEATHVWSHKQRIALFLSAMRHFAAELTVKAYPLHYLKLEQHAFDSLAEALSHYLATLQPSEVCIVRPGDYRVLAEIATTCKRHGIPLKQLHDNHFLSTPQGFRDWAGTRKQLRMEFWYRELRKQHNVLLEDGKQPIGGKWNYDHDNRKTFPKSGPNVSPPVHLENDAITREVITLVQARFSAHPGSLASLNWAVNPSQAQQVLQHFLDHALPQSSRTLPVANISRK